MSELNYHYIKLKLILKIYYKIKKIKHVFLDHGCITQTYVRAAKLYFKTGLHVFFGCLGRNN
jgi:hypothetical protein